jgi:poly-gamma-glutamate capsule biosynthesis protein CapA/YwtB (metallophosphatase superfamily)
MNIHVFKIHVFFMCIWMAIVQSADASTEVSLVFAGDTVLNESAGLLIEKGEDPFANFADYLAHSDIKITNLECVVSTKGSSNEAKIFSFQAHPRVIPVLRRHFDAVALANNHSGDFGIEAFTDMLMLLKQGGLEHVGGGMNLRQAHTPLIFHRKGLRIAVLSYNEFHPRSFEAGFDWPGVAWSEDEQVVSDIQNARRVHQADIVIPLMHWGWENELHANPRQQQLAKLMIDAGADAVIGGHPHVTQDVVLYQNKPIIYSVGNFVMQQTDNDRQRQAWLIKLFINRQGVSRFETLPVNIDMEGLPSLDRHTDSPCWTKGEKIGSCSAFSAH